MRIYVVSKIKWASLWRDVRCETIPIISSWIDDGYLENMQEAWPRYLREAASATHVIVFCPIYDTPLKGGLFEIGAALGGGAKAVVVGQIPTAMKTMVQHPDIQTVGTLAEAITWLPKLEEN